MWAELFIGPDPGLQIPEDVWETALTDALDHDPDYDMTSATADLVPDDGVSADELTDDLPFHHDFAHSDHDGWMDSDNGHVETDPYHVPFADDSAYDPFAGDSSYGTDEPDDS